MGAVDLSQTWFGGRGGYRNFKNEVWGSNWKNWCHLGGGGRQRGGIS